MRGRRRAARPNVPAPCGDHANLTDSAYAHFLVQRKKYSTPRAGLMTGMLILSGICIIRRIGRFGSEWVQLCAVGNHRRIVNERARLSRKSLSGLTLL